MCLKVMLPTELSATPNAVSRRMTAMKIHAIAFCYDRGGTMRDRIGECVRDFTCLMMTDRPDDQQLKA